MNTNLVLTRLSSWRSLWSRQARSRKKDKAWWRSSRCQSSWCRRSREGSGSSRWNWKVDSSYDFCLILLLYFLHFTQIKSQEHIISKYLQSWEDKHDGKVDLDDHGDILVGEAVDHLAQEHQHASRQGYLDIVFSCEKSFLFTVRKLEKTGRPRMTSTATPCFPSNRIEHIHTVLDV